MTLKVSTGNEGVHNYVQRILLKKTIKSNNNFCLQFNKNNNHYFDLFCLDLWIQYHGTFWFTVFTINIVYTNEVKDLENILWNSVNKKYECLAN